MSEGVFEGLWRARFTIVLLLCGTAVLIFASTNGFEVGTFALRPTGSGWRLALAIIGGLALLGAAVLELLKAKRPEAPAVDAKLRVAQDSHFLIDSYQDVLARTKEIVRNANKYLVTSGSRSRDEDYLREIENVLQERPQLVHYRVLIGPPHHQLLKDHLLRLLELRSAPDQTRGQRTLHLGIFDGPDRPSEAFICASESEGIVILPSLTATTAYDTALVLRDRRWIEGLNAHVRQLYAGGRKLEDAEAIRALETTL